MSREDFVAVASRLFSIFLLVTIVRNAPGSIAQLSQDMDAAVVGFIFMALAAGLALCALLWFFPLTVARKLLPVMKEPKSDASIDASTGLSLGLTLIGVWLMAYALVDAIYWIALFLRTRQIDAAYFEWSHEHIASMAATIAEIVLAIWLIFGATGIKRLLYRYRYGSSQDAA